MRIFANVCGEGLKLGEIEVMISGDLASR